MSKVKNFAKALNRRLAVPKEHRNVPNQVREERIKICQSCDMLKIKFGRPHCSHHKCGCTVTARRSFWNKLNWSTEKCPLSPPRWDVYTYPEDEVKAS